MGNPISTPSAWSSSTKAEGGFRREVQRYQANLI
jgi:hypothetical protein